MREEILALVQERTGRFRARKEAAQRKGQHVQRLHLATIQAGETLAKQIDAGWRQEVEVR